MIQLTDEEILEALNDRLSHFTYAVCDRHKQVTKAQLRKFINWGNEICREHQPEVAVQVKGVTSYIYSGTYTRSMCPECWQALLKETK